MHSRLNIETYFDATLASVVYRRMSHPERTMHQLPSMAPSQIESIRCSATYKLASESRNHDRDLRHILGHLGLLDHVDDEINKSRQQWPVVPQYTPTSQSYDKIESFDILTSPRIDVSEEEVPAEDFEDESSDSSTDEGDVDDFEFWEEDEDNDSEHQLIRVQSHPLRYVLIPTSSSKRKEQSFQSLLPEA